MPVTVAGTFEVNLPALAATTFAYSTAVTLDKVRATDIVNVTVQSAADATARIFAGAVPQDGQLTLYFLSTGDAVNSDDFTCAYTIARSLRE